MLRRNRQTLWLHWWASAPLRRPPFTWLAAELRNWQLQPTCDVLSSDGRLISSRIQATPKAGCGAARSKAS